MAKRKADVNDIIYELDNSDIEISSDEEIKESKIRRFVQQTAKNLNKNHLNETINHEVISIDSSEEISIVNLKNENGGKSETETSVIKNTSDYKKQTNNFLIKNFDIINHEKSGKNCSDTIVFDEDIDVDSPAANTTNSDISVIGCENRIPLVTVRFRDNKLAQKYKRKVKDFLLNLIKLDNTSHTNDDTDVEFDIWDEDLVEENGKTDETEDTTFDDNLFFMDTGNCEATQIDVPVYNKTSCVISNSPEKEDTCVPSGMRKVACFNCDGEHSLRDCHLPRDNYRIAERRKNIPKLGRYHVEDDQKYGHLVPGRISGALRTALGLKRYELPLHIYKMRLLGYPPGWLEEARISHSGIRLFDASGSAILDPEEEDGELIEPGSKDKFDIKKILDFPGFNVPASSRYIDEAHLIGYPPMSEADSKMLMLQALAPNAMKAYKRKKLTFFPANNISAADGQMEMELDSGDEIVEFPSIPPLPDEAPPPPPPPPPEEEPPPPGEESPNPKSVSKKDSSVKSSEINKNILNASNEDNKDNVDNDLEVIEVLHVPDIPIPDETFITIDEDYDSTSVDSSRNSPTLDDLEEKKKLLLSALKDGAESEVSVINISDNGDTQDTTTDLEEIETMLDTAEEQQKGNDSKLKEKQENMQQDRITKDEENVGEKCFADNENIVKIDTIEEGDVKAPNKEHAIDDNDTNKPSNTEESENQNDSEVKEQSDIKSVNQKTGKVKTTAYGTPVINVASPYLKLPSEDKFAKDICDVINFENLPNSTGKFKRIRSLLKKVKSEVDRIQDS